MSSCLAYVGLGGCAWLGDKTKKKQQKHSSELDKPSMTHSRFRLALAGRLWTLIGRPEHPTVKPYIEEKLSNEVLCCPDRLGAKEAANLEPFYYASAMGC